MSPARAQESQEPADSEALRSLLEYLKSSRGFDFSGYKRSSLERRIRKRMSAVEIDDYERYQDYLQVTPDEFTELFNTILVNVTGFFRDRPAWDYLAGEVIPELLESVTSKESIRVWSAACATGEEAYSVAMLFADVLGEKQFRERVKIYATDVDEEALHRARMGAYPRDGMKGLSDDHRAKYFQHGPLGYTFRTELRRAVIFGRNDLVQDAPISKVDLLISRNALMYFTPETQARILGHFNFAMKDSGFLFLGKSEMLITHRDLFTPHHLKWRVFRKVQRRALRDRLPFPNNGLTFATERVDDLTPLRAAALDVAPIAQVVVDRSGFVTAVNQMARKMFGLGVSDIGRPLPDLELSYRPAELRSALERAYKEARPVMIGRVAWKVPGGEETTLEVSVTPITGADAEPWGASFYFQDVTDFVRLDEEYIRSKRNLETAYEELQSTVEELETTNEELHSTNEELETTNEELQSSNEELETMNEELHSTNDELETMNEEQATRAQQLDQANLFLEGLLGTLGVGVVVLDHEGRVQIWNASSMDLWGLRPEEVEGEQFLELDIGLPVAELQEPIAAAVSGDGKQFRQAFDAVTRRGNHVDCVVTIEPLLDGGASRGAIVMTSVAEARATGG